MTVTGYTSDFFGKDPDTYPGHPEYADVFGVDDFAAALFAWKMALCWFSLSWAMHMDTTGDALILGTKGGLRIPSTECWNGDFDKPLKIYKKVAGEEICYEVPLKVGGSFENLFYDKLRSFVDAVKTNGKAIVPTSEIIYNQAIIDGIIRSNALGHEIEIHIPEI